MADKQEPIEGPQLRFGPRIPTGGVLGGLFGTPIYEALVSAGVEADLALEVEQIVAAKADQRQTDEMVNSLQDLFDRSTKHHLEFITTHNKLLEITAQQLEDVKTKLSEVEKIATENKPEYHEVLSQQKLLNDRYNIIFSVGKALIYALVTGAVFIVADHFDILEKLSGLGINLSGQ